MQYAPSRTCWVRLVALIALAATAENPEEDGVLVLDGDSFEVALKTNPYTMVLFYAPWCGQCKQFAPEYAAAAKRLKQADPPVLLAKVDVTVEHRLAEEFGVRGYPTVRLFHYRRDLEYTGGRAESSIVAWVLKKVGRGAIPLADVPDAESFERDNEVAVIGLFDEATSRTAFETVAKDFENAMFAYSTAPPVIARYKVKTPAIKMFFPADEQVANFAGDVQDSDAISEFVRSYRHPLVMPFSEKSASGLFAESHIFLFLFRDSDDKGKHAEQELRKAAPSFGRRMRVLTAGSSEPTDQRLMDYIRVEPEELPTVRLVSSPMAGTKTYKLQGHEVTEAAILHFVQEYEAGRLKPYVKSEGPSTSQPGSVVTVVGSNFQRIVKDPSKDVLVQFHAPWCGHCKKMEPVYRELAKKLEAVSTIIIAKIDATANDVAGVDIEGFPTIKFWRADNKQNPLDYDGDRDVDSFLAWLEANAAYPFNRGDFGRREL